MVAVLNERHVATRDLCGRRVAHAVRQLAGDLLVGHGARRCLRRVARRLLRCVRRGAPLGASLGFYPRGTVGDVEVLLGVVLGA